MTTAEQRAWTEDLLVYAHIGDLHIADESMQNTRDFRAIVADIESIRGNVLDFVFLPGDNADNGSDAQCELVAAGLAPLGIPVHAIAGDHDMETGSLAPFYRSLGARKLPYALRVGRTRCVFLDVSGSGKGGPDFRLPPDQSSFLQSAIDEARDTEDCVAVFMHTYPSDLARSDEQAAVNELLSDPIVRLVDMGHTHYNELANDGLTIFAATRSTGQVEEGPVGYSITAVDGDHVSWRFKLLDDHDPFVVVTSPTDRRLQISAPDGHARSTVHAVVMSADRVTRCEWRADDGPWQAMVPTADGRAFGADAVGTDAPSKIEVCAHTSDGRKGSDIIELDSGDHREFARDGSDRDTIGAWGSRHVFGTQLGPNRNGRKW